MTTTTDDTIPPKFCKHGVPICSGCEAAALRADLARARANLREITETYKPGWAQGLHALAIQLGWVEDRAFAGDYDPASFLDEKMRAAADDLARVTAERDAALSDSLAVAKSCAELLAERDRATAAAAAMREQLEEDACVFEDVDGSDCPNAVTVRTLLASTDVGAAYAREHEEMRTTLKLTHGRLTHLAGNNDAEASVLRSAIRDIERVLKGGGK